MVMVVNIDELNREFTKFIDSFSSVSENKNVDIHIMHEDIFNAMHKI
jgi:ACT domain-containing protein